MAKKSDDSLTPAEWKIMRMAWEEKSGASRDFCREGKGKYNWSPSTVKTLLSRLVAKGFLKTSRVGNSYLYRPARPALKTLYNAADTLLKNVVGGASGPLLSYMVKKSKLSSKEIEELQVLLDNHQEE